MNIRQNKKNKKNMKRPKKYILIATLLLFAVLSTLSAALTACQPAADNGNQDKNQSENSAVDSESPEEAETENEIKDSLPDDLDFNGTALNLLVRGDCNVDTNVPEFGVETENGDIINDVIYKRDKAVEDRLNLKINIITGSGWQDYNQDVNMIRSNIAAGDNSFDLIAGWSARIPSLSIEGMFLNLYEVPHVNFSEPWWNQRIVEDLTIGSQLHFAVGDGNLSLLCNCMCMFVNNDLQREYGLPDIYETIFAGKWTLDAMNELAKPISKDLNGDGIMDSNDQYGAVFDNYNAYDGFLQGSNIVMIYKDDNGMPYLDMEYEKLSIIVDKVHDFLFNGQGVFNTTEADALLTPMFKNNQALFIPGWLLRATQSLRDMESDYSIIPYPKFDEAQEKYYTRIQDGVSLFCIPINSDKTEMVGAFMEAAASESYKNVSSVYFDVAMKVKYARDETSSKMLDIIREGAYLNFAGIYNESLGNPWHVLRALMNTKSNNFASWYEKNEPKISQAVTKLVEKMESAG